MSAGSECLVYRLAEVARMLGVSSRTITRWEESGLFPRRLNFVSVRVYDRGEVDRWFEGRHRKVD